MNLDLGPLVEDKKDRMREKVGSFSHVFDDKLLFLY